MVSIKNNELILFHNGFYFKLNKGLGAAKYLELSLLREADMEPASPCYDIRFDRIFNYGGIDFSPIYSDMDKLINEKYNYLCYGCDGVGSNIIDGEISGCDECDGTGKPEGEQ